mgnify:FL=1
MMLLLQVSGVGYKLARQCIGSNCTKFSSICCSFEREALDNADALDLRFLKNTIDERLFRKTGLKNLPSWMLITIDKFQCLCWRHIWWKSCSMVLGFSPHTFPGPFGVDNRTRPRPYPSTCLETLDFEARELLVHRDDRRYGPNRDT